MLLRSLVGSYVRETASKQLRGIVDQKIKQTEEMQRRRADEPITAAVVFATSIESGGLVDLLQDLLTTKYETFVERSGRFKGHTILIAETGVGLEKSEAGIRDLISFHKPPLVFAAGFAASLDAELKKGHILIAEKVSDEQGNYFEFAVSIDRATIEAKPNWHLGHLVSVEREIMNFQQRSELAAATGAAACDMETFAIAKVCRELKVPCISIRVIADGLKDGDKQVLNTISKQTTFAAKLGATAGAIWRKPKIATEMIGVKQAAIERSDQLAQFIAGLLKQIPKPKVQVEPDAETEPKRIELSGP